MSKDLYETLGVSKTASADEIKSAYRQLAKKYHPDQNPGDAAAEAKFKEISVAYEVLSDQGKRSNYDRFGSADGMGGFGGGGGAGFGDFSDFAGQAFGGFSDFFGDIFGGFGDFMGGGRRQRANRGADVSIKLNLTFAESCLGCKKTVTYSRFERCRDCNGTGAKGGVSMSTCTHCHGHGRVKQTSRLGPLGMIENVVPCSACNATGKVIKEKCGSCSKGANKRTVTYEVNVPAGIADGQILNIAGEGDAAQGIDGMSGALLISVRVEKHPLLVRDDFDLYLELPVSFTEAILGTKVSVPTVEGAKMEFVIPPNTQSGWSQRIKGKGVKKLRGYGQGDMVVRVLVEMPKHLDRKQTEVIRALDKDISGKDYVRRREYLEKLYR